MLGDGGKDFFGRAVPDAVRFDVFDSVIDGRVGLIHPLIDVTFDDAGGERAGVARSMDL